MRPPLTPARSDAARSPSSSLGRIAPAWCPASWISRASPPPERFPPPGLPRRSARHHFSQGIAEGSRSVTDMAGPVQILVVDDEEPIRNALKKFLTQQQFEVYAAGSGEEALQQLKRHRIALMLCDIRMPGTSGVDLVPDALEIEPELAILMLTAVN